MLVKGQRATDRLKMVIFLYKLNKLSPLNAFHQHLHRTVGKLEHLENACKAANGVDVVAAGLVLSGRALGRKQDMNPRLHGLFHGPNRLGSAHKEGNHHMREDNNVPQRQHGQMNRLSRENFGLRHGQ